MIATTQPLQPRAHPEALAQGHCARCDQQFLADQPTRFVASRGVDGWVHVRCPAATEIVIGADRSTQVVTWSRRDITSPAPPTHPFASLDLRMFRAWIESEMYHPGDQRAAIAAITTVIERYYAGRRLGVADVWSRLPDWLRPHLTREPGEGMKLLLGRWDRAGAFVPADVPEPWQLGEDEAMVYWWNIRGWTFEEIQREMTTPRLRGNREYWVRAERVEGLIESARAKVRGMFGVA